MKKNSSFIALLFLVSLLLLVFVDPVFAAGAKGAKGGYAPATIGTLFYPAINFILFFSILVFAYRKVGRAKLVELHTDVKEYLKRAAEDLGSAEASHQAAEQRLARIEDEKQELIAALNREGENTSESVLAKAEQAVENSLLDTKRRIDNEVARTQTELRGEVVARATALAREKVAGRLTVEDDARLRREAIQRIG